MEMRGTEQLLASLRLIDRTECMWVCMRGAV